MAGYTRKTNDSLFSFDDDVDDEEFLKNRRTGNYLDSERDSFGNSAATNNTSEAGKGLDERRLELLLKRKEIEQRTIKSTEKSLSYLRSSEEVGAATAEELLRQREQLERTEKRLDDINSTLRFSQRHIQGIKSVFGGLKNLISGKTLPSKEAQKTNENSTSASMGNNKPDLKSFSNDTVHPGLRIHDKYFDDSKPNSDLSAQEVIDDNLGHMLSSINKLKGLAHGLSEELDSQNEMIDNVLEKADRADCTLHKQTKDINKLMK